MQSTSTSERSFLLMIFPPFEKISFFVTIYI